MKKLALVLATVAAAALAACSKPVDTASTGPDSAASTTASSTSSSSDTSTASAASTASPAPSAGTSSDTVAANGPSVTPAPSGTSPDALNTAAMGASGPGPDTYAKACVVCHGAGVAGAPKLGDKADWGPRIAQGNDILYEHAIKGYTGKKGMMPPKGGNTALPDADVKAAVDYMVAQGK